DLRVLERDVARLLLGELRRRVRRRELRLDEVALRVVDGARGRRGGVRGRGERERGEECDGRAAHQRRRNDQSLLPTKFSGVTSTIASAWATILPRPKATRTRRQTRFAPSAIT